MKADEVIWQAFAMGLTLREEYRWVASMQRGRKASGSL
jgi:hypothetical protein